MLWCASFLLVGHRYSSLSPCISTEYFISMLFSLNYYYYYSSTRGFLFAKLNTVIVSHSHTHTPACQLASLVRINRTMNGICNAFASIFYKIVDDLTRVWENFRLIIVLVLLLLLLFSYFVRFVFCFECFTIVWDVLHKIAQISAKIERIWNVRNKFINRYQLDAICKWEFQLVNQSTAQK